MNPVKQGFGNILQGMSILLQAGGASQQFKESQRPDVVMTRVNGNLTCTMDDSQIAAIRNRTRIIMNGGIEAGFGHFPIDRERFRSAAIHSLLTKKAICNALAPSETVTKLNHNAEREKYKTSALSVEKARARGMTALRLPATMVCPSQYDWVGSPHYNGMASCEAVISKSGDKKLPVMLYASSLPPAEIQRQIRNPANLPFYTNYASSGLKVCSMGPRLTESFHKIKVGFLKSAEYVLRAKEGNSWSAWSLVRSCNNGGKTYKADHLAFNFGARFMIPVTVLSDGTTSRHTLVMTTGAAASNSRFAWVVPVSHAFERFIGGEYAKKIFLDSTAHGWQIK